jgi:CheY-like chemotaxis protein
MEQVFLNLAVNGWHAMTLMKKDNWGGTLTIKVEETSLSDTLKTAHPEAQEDLYWRISFIDQGVGMSEETQKKIFEPFFTTKDVGKGTGLGLSMVFNIISMHSGFVHVDSELGVGSNFQVFIPKAIVDEAAEADTSNEVMVYKGNQESVLVIDDELVVRQTITNILEESNYKAILVESGQKAIELYKKDFLKIDLVLVDYKMPVMNGVETFIELKKINPRIKAIFYSGYKPDDILELLRLVGIKVDDVLDFGFKQFIQKPFTITKLTKAISEVLKS